MGSHLVAKLCRDMESDCLVGSVLEDVLGMVVWFCPHHSSFQDLSEMPSLFVVGADVVGVVLFS